MYVSKPYGNKDRAYKLIQLNKWRQKHKSDARARAIAAFVPNPPSKLSKVYFYVKLAYWRLMDKQQYQRQLFLYRFFN